nr:unnamed protein product [Callosobruchus chinensis]
MDHRNLEKNISNLGLRLSSSTVNYTHNN